jgi:hypothetical protein
MAGGPIVESPDGSHWQVRRRLLERPLPDLRERFRGSREGRAEDALDLIWGLDLIDSSLTPLAIAVGLILVVLVLLPLLGIALELIVVLILLGSGVLARVVLRRPWVIEARNLDDRDRSVSYGVSGWRASGEAIEALRTAIAAAGPPELA